MRLARVTTLAAALALAAAPAVAEGPATPATDASAHPLAGAIVDTASGARLAGPTALAARLGLAPLVILGEVHDNPEHHAAQAWLVSAIRPKGLAFEMIPRSAEGAVARLRREGADTAALAAALDWEARGWPDFALYAPILAAAPAAEVTGGAIDRAGARTAIDAGAAAAARGLIGAAAARYGLDRPLDPADAAEAAQEQVDAHCGAIPEDLAARMVEAQRLRDAAFADALLRARTLGGGAAVLIAGAGHAREDRGTPAALAAAEPGLAVATLALVEVAEGAEDWRAYGADADGAPVFDYLWFTAPHPREDPCLAFTGVKP
jgi:uncharacterized iron-regulated protein